MKPKIISRGQILLVGFGFFGDPFARSGGWNEENEIAQLWKRYVQFMAKHGKRVNHIKNASLSYEVHVHNEETAEKGNFEVFLATEVEKLDAVPMELSIKMLPAATYAVLTLRGKQITSDWAQTIYNVWMPKAGYQPTHNYSFQLYDERFKGLDRIDESILDVYIPVRKKS